MALRAPPKPEAPLSLTVRVSWSELAGASLALLYVKPPLVLDNRLLIAPTEPLITKLEVLAPETTLMSAKLPTSFRVPLATVAVTVNWLVVPASTSLICKPLPDNEASVCSVATKGVVDALTKVGASLTATTLRVRVMATDEVPWLSVTSTEI